MVRKSSLKQRHFLNEFRNKSILLNIMRKRYVSILALPVTPTKYKKPSATANTSNNKRENVANAPRSGPHPKNGEKAAIESSLTLQLLSTRRPPTHSPILVLHHTPPPLFQNATTRSVSHSTNTLWSNLLPYLHFLISSPLFDTNQSEFGFNPCSSLRSNHQCPCPMSINRASTLLFHSDD